MSVWQPSLVVCTVWDQLFWGGFLFGGGRFSQFSLLRLLSHEDGDTEEEELVRCSSNPQTQNQVHCQLPVRTESIPVCCCTRFIKPSCTPLTEVQTTINWTSPKSKSRWEKKCWKIQLNGKNQLNHCSESAEPLDSPHESPILNRKICSRRRPSTRTFLWIFANKRHFFRTFTKNAISVLQNVPNIDSARGQLFEAKSNRCGRTRKSPKAGFFFFAPQTLVQLYTLALLVTKGNYLANETPNLRNHHKTAVYRHPWDAWKVVLLFGIVRLLKRTPRNWPCSFAFFGFFIWLFKEKPRAEEKRRLPFPGKEECIIITKIIASFSKDWNGPFVRGGAKSATFGKGKCELIQTFSASVGTGVPSLFLPPSVTPCVSLTLRTSRKLPSTSTSNLIQ